MSDDTVQVCRCSESFYLPMRASAAPMVLVINDTATSVDSIQQINAAELVSSPWLTANLSPFLSSLLKDVSHRGVFPVLEYIERLVALSPEPSMPQIYILYDRFVEFVDDAWSGGRHKFSSWVLAKIWIGIVEKSLISLLRFPTTCAAISFIESTGARGFDVLVGDMGAGIERFNSDREAPIPVATHWRQAEEIWGQLTDTVLINRISSLQTLVDNIFRSRFALTLSEHLRHSPMSIRHLHLRPEAACASQWSCVKEPETSGRVSIGIKSQGEAWWNAVEPTNGKISEFFCVNKLLFGEYRCVASFRSLNIGNPDIHISISIIDVITGNVVYHWNKKVLPLEEVAWCDEFSANGLYNLRLTVDPVDLSNAVSGAEILLDAFDVMRVI